MRILKLSQIFVSPYCFPTPLTPGHSSSSQSALPTLPGAGIYKTSSSSPLRSGSTAPSPIATAPRSGCTYAGWVCPKLLHNLSGSATSASSFQSHRLSCSPAQKLLQVVCIRFRGAVFPCPWLPLGKHHFTISLQPVSICFLGFVLCQVRKQLLPGCFKLRPVINYWPALMTATLCSWCVAVGGFHRHKNLYC